MYGSAAAFETYHEGRGRTVPGTWDTEYIEAALLVASEWIDNKYGDRFYGYPTDGYTQTRKWPRTAAVANVTPVYVFGHSETPVEVVNATYEAAWREATTPGSLNVDYTPSKYTSVSISGAVSVSYNTSIDAVAVQTQIVIIEMILKPLFDPSKYSSGLSGSVSRV